MDIGSIGNLNSAYNRPATKQQEAEKAPEAGMEEQAARKTSIPAAMPSGASGGASGAAQGGEQAQAKREEAMLKQAAASVNGASATSAAVTTTGTEDDEDSAYETIVAKADSGQTLTSSELSQLRAKDPARYYKALRASEARTALREQMEESPGSASKAMKEAVSSVRAQVEAARGEAGGAHGTIDEKTASAMISALNDEYAAFSKKYDQVMF